MCINKFTYMHTYTHTCTYIHTYIHTYYRSGIYIIYMYPDMWKHQNKPQVYKSDIAPCGQI